MTDSARRWALLVALIGVTAVWGVTFVMVKEATASYPVYAFLAVRFAIAAVAFAAMFPSSLRRLSDRSLMAVGIGAGVLLTAGYVLQTLGLQLATASVTAFITGLFVVLTPLFEYVAFRRSPGWGAAVGVALAVPGLWLLSGASASGWGAGEWLVLGGAVAFAAHLVMLAGPGRRFDPMALTFVQLAFTAVACGVMSLATAEHAPVPSGGQLWVALLVCGVLASAVAFGVQTYALRYLSATRTALIMVMEPVFGGVFGYLLAHEVLGVAGMAGAAMILGGMVASEAGRFTRKRGAVIADVEGTAVPVAEETA